MNGNFSSGTPRRSNDHVSWSCYVWQSPPHLRSMYRISPQPSGICFEATVRDTRKFIITRWACNFVVAHAALATNCQKPLDTSNSSVFSRNLVAPCISNHSTRDSSPLYIYSSFNSSDTKFIFKLESYIRNLKCNKLAVKIISSTNIYK